MYVTKLIDGHITVKEATLCLEFSERQILKLKKWVLNEGPAFLTHKNKGRKPAQQETTYLPTKNQD
ncbi:helix-turn-helix domain-containing protein [Carboxydothermus pertinax]|uniref:Helix-turn-helix domain-containing protein n=1 Tax=Carboxydothermus pertinax TaxID=870242 RepID=A0A1L8CY58_9THEO|nr:helix-turn-helix domain-containing protein [Carboxydothermus pertinax]